MSVDSVIDITSNSVFCFLAGNETLEGGLAKQVNPAHPEC